MPAANRNDVSRTVSTFPAMSLLRIEPLNDGWVLFCDRNALAQIFRSGAEAERQARRQATVLASCGFVPRLAVVDRAGNLTRVRL